MALGYRGTTLETLQMKEARRRDWRHWLIIISVCMSSTVFWFALGRLSVHCECSCDDSVGKYPYLVLPSDFWVDLDKFGNVNFSISAGDEVFFDDGR